MKKYGFTLAEVLIALGIIGVVASLTAPTFVSNIRNTANASRLSATVSTLENAFTTMIAKEDVDTEDLLFDTEAWREHSSDKKAFAGCLSDYLSIESFRELANNSAATKGYYGPNNGPYILNTNGSKNSTVNETLARYLVQTGNNVPGGNHVLNLKNGATVFLIVNNQDGQPSEEVQDKIREQGGGITSIAADIWIDVNGTDAPNTLGRDIFAFYLANNGKLYPLGGKDVQIYDNGGQGNPSLWNNGNGRGCTNNNIQSGGYGCTARVVEEGYKINY